MKLLIDNREPESIIKYINYLNDLLEDKINIEIKSLDVGDYIFFDEIENKNMIIIERKSLSDLESSIKDGRYTEQSYRLTNIQDIHNHNIYYLIEGNISNYKNKKFINTIYSTLISLNYYKGFSVIKTLNNIETAESIFYFFCKILKEKKKNGYYLNFLSNNLDKNENNLDKNENNLDKNGPSNDKTDSYLENIKIKKKENITLENINMLMLMQIPSVNYKSAKSILDTHKTIKNLVIELENNINCLNNIKYQDSNRKINKTTIENIKNYLL
jgi:ERCC4-type nuclease